jgi:protocatechuate 3,4-dioxygenase beta subunit
MRLNRRELLRFSLLGLPAPLVLLACGGDETPTSANSGAGAAAPDLPQSTATNGVPRAASTPDPISGATQLLTPTPACGDADDLTPAQTEGPYFTPNSPERVSLRESGMRGTTLVLEGLVVSRACLPVSRALVDFWQCDDAGVYDNTGFRLRGHQFTDANGRYRLETILPGIYTGRTRHIHVKVQAPNRPVLTMQLYFPNEAQNQRDGIYSPDLVLENYRDASGGKTGSFNFVLNL